MNCVYFCIIAFFLTLAKGQATSFVIVVDASTELTSLSVFEWEVDILENVKRIYFSSMAPLGNYINAKTGKINSTDLQKDFRGLVDGSMSKIPADSVPQTNFYLLGRGNLRYLRNEYSERLIQSIRTIVRQNYKVVSQVGRYVRLVSAEEEAIFLWIGVQFNQENYKLHEKSYATVSMSKSTSTVAFIPLDEQVLSHKTSFRVFGDIIQAYSESFLRYGTVEAFQLSLEYLDPKTAETNVTHPCLFKDSSFYDPSQKRYFVGTSDFSQCELLIRNIFSWKQRQACYYPSCTLSNTYLSPIQLNQTFYAYGEFTNILKGLKISTSSPPTILPQVVYDKSSEFCQNHNFAWAEKESGFTDPKLVLTQCFDAMLGMGFLKDQLKMDLRSHPFKFIDNTPVNTMFFEIGFLLYEKQFEKENIPEDVTEIYYKVSMIIGFVFFGLAVCVNVCMIATICFLCFKINAMKPSAEYVDLQ